MLGWKDLAIDCQGLPIAALRSFIVTPEVKQPGKMAEALCHVFVGVAKQFAAHLECLAEKTFGLSIFPLLPEHRTKAARGHYGVPMLRSERPAPVSDHLSQARFCPRQISFPVAERARVVERQDSLRVIRPEEGALHCDRLDEERFGLLQFWIGSLGACQHRCQFPQGSGHLGVTLRI